MTIAFDQEKEALVRVARELENWVVHKARAENRIGGVMYGDYWTFVSPCFWGGKVKGLLRRSIF